MDFEIGDKQYRTGKLDAFKQLHVSRRIAPIIPTLIPLFVKISQDGENLNVFRDMSVFAQLIEPFAEGLAGMSDEASEYVISTCLSVVKRKAAGDNWAPVWSQSAKACMFDDMDLGDLIQITIKVISDSLGGFIQGLLMSQVSSPE